MCVLFVVPIVSTQVAGFRYRAALVDACIGNTQARMPRISTFIAWVMHFVVQLLLSACPAVPHQLSPSKSNPFHASHITLKLLELNEPANIRKPVLTQYR